MWNMFPLRALGQWEKLAFSMCPLAHPTDRVSLGLHVCMSRSGLLEQLVESLRGLRPHSASLRKSLLLPQDVH